MIPVRFNSKKYKAKLTTYERALEAKYVTGGGSFVHDMTVNGIQGDTTLKLT